MTGFLSVAAGLPQLFDALSLTESQAGWLTGSAFASYALTVPLFTALTDRFDARSVVFVSLCLTALSGIGFALFAEAYWSAIALRLIAGVGFAGVHFPGLKMLVDRLPGYLITRGSGIYVSMFSLGGAGSFLVAGLVVAFLPWPWVFIISGLCSVLSAILIWVAIAPKKPHAASSAGITNVRRVISNVEAMRYGIAYFGHIWEMFSFRQWFVVFLGLNIGLASNSEYAGWNLPLLAALTSLAAWPASLAVMEISQHFSRKKVVTLTVLTSLCVAIALSMMALASTPLLLGVMIFYSMTCFGDSSAMAGGVIGAVDARVRGMALAMYALLGFCGGALGPAVVGMVLEAAGGRHEPVAWVLAWLTIGAGTLVVAGAINCPWRSKLSELKGERK